MKSAIRHSFWVLSNWWGLVFGHAWLAPVHHLLLNLTLHSLGYDNARFTGEEWFIKNVLKKAGVKTCIDVGANIGGYSMPLIKYLDCKVYAIEPSSSSFAQLQKNLQDKNVVLIKAALSDHEGMGTLFSRRTQSEKATLSPVLGEGSSIQEEVRVTTLDTVVQENSISEIDLIKIDTEGHELEVFRGMRHTLSQLKPRFIQFEFNHVHLYRDTTLLELSRELPHYQLYRLLPHGWIKIDPIKYANNIFMFCNIIAVRT
jgi:FkbM family methyltransferase